MPSTVIEQLRDFHRFLGDKLSTNGADLSPEEALDEWRKLHPEATEAEETAAIQESLDDLANGDRGISFDEFDRDFRKRHKLPAKS